MPYAGNAAAGNDAGPIRITFSRVCSHFDKFFMENVLNEYENRLIHNGLVKPGEATYAIRGKNISWNRSHSARLILEPLFGRLSIKSLLFARPAKPYDIIIDYLAQSSTGTIRTQDSETRLFLKDLPVTETFSTDAIGQRLKHRNIVIISGHGIVAWGEKTVAQAFVIFSSVCFACFVKFFSDFLKDAKSGKITDTQKQAFESAVKYLHNTVVFNERLAQYPFETADEVISAIIEAGRKLVDLRLVDANFGNISYLYDNMLYISKTGSFLDSLQGQITACPLDETSPAPADASSELPAHLQIVRNTGCRAVLHGHPKFSVILSLDCDRDACCHKGECHLHCPEKRQICGAPIVSGEVGGGNYGLCHTVPAAIKEKSSVIVYGHGVFTADPKDFNGALKRLIDIETQCRIEYFNRIKSLTAL